ncbi:MAG TPA: peptidylprolyl isomerase [Candidatus Angelobacter sp.]|jgi:peptidyl-prolyl cis-trans isomerase SurA|nr:peptidylprolyl isomerase [Candidatus Angelobacter sp.]
MKNKTFFFLVFFIVFYALNAQQKQKIDGVAAIIGDKIISESDVRENILNTDKKLTSCEVLKEMIKSNVLLYHAKKDKNISNRISVDQIRLRVKKILKELAIQVGGMKNLLKKYEKNSVKELSEEYTENVRNNELIKQFFKEKITSNVNVSPFEVQEFCKKHKEKLPIFPEKLYFYRIVFYPKLKNSHRKEIINKLEKIKKYIEKGSTFEVEAIAYSQDNSTAFKGGLIKNMNTSNMSSTLYRVLSSLKEGEISEPFESEFGFQIVKLEKLRKNRIDYRNILMKKNSSKEEMDKTKKYADSIREFLYKKKISFEEALEKYSIEDDFKFSLDKNQLSKNSYSALIHVKNGGISYTYEDEIKGKKAYFLLKILKRIPAHKPTLENEYQFLKNFVSMEKSSNELTKWVNFHIPDIFIGIGENFQKCFPGKAFKAIKR